MELCLLRGLKPKVGLDLLLDVALDAPEHLALLILVRGRLLFDRGLLGPRLSRDRGNFRLFAGCWKLFVFGFICCNFPISDLRSVLSTC